MIDTIETATIETVAIESAANETAAKPYRVLARKYRPDSFETLIGQDVLVRTLTNAIALGRLAHAFVLTGVRGIGKTSTARILARGLNCEGADGKGGPTLKPCGVCQHCKDIADSRHIDVLEMDAASNTGVDDVREIIEGVAYRPVSARFKIYIIDEVHMLSRNAFNALLKTLEEPPDNVKFIFATTEIRKVPVTILSRCQRFDLRRVPMDMLSVHLDKIAQAESIDIDAAALKQICRAAEGSVRDALSLLDQAAAMGGDKISEQAIIEMFAQADSGQILEILKNCMEGEIVNALELFGQADAGGAAAETIISDMLELIHSGCLIAAGAKLSDQPEALLAGLEELSKSGIGRLGRAWQIVLAGNEELKKAPNPKTAAQMLIIRLAHVAPMPTPAEIIKKLPDAPKKAEQPVQSTQPAPSTQSTRPSQPAQSAPPARPSQPARPAPPAQSTQPQQSAPPTQSTQQPQSAPPAQSSRPAHSAPTAQSTQPARSTQSTQQSQPSQSTQQSQPTQTQQQQDLNGSPEAPDEDANQHDKTMADKVASPIPDSAAKTVPKAVSETVPETVPPPALDNNEPADTKSNIFSDLRQIADRLEAKGERLLATHVRRYLRPISISAGKLDIQMDDKAPDYLIRDLTKFLSQTSEQNWMVTTKETGGGPTIVEEDEIKERENKSAFEQTPLVSAVLDTFSGAKITNIIKTDEAQENNQEMPATALSEKRES